MKSITLSFPATVITAATDPYDFEQTDEKSGQTVRRSGQRRTCWLLIEPGEPPLECRAADDLADWHDVVEAQGARITATVKLRAFSSNGNKAQLVGDLLAAGPCLDDLAEANGYDRDAIGVG